MTPDPPGCTFKAPCGLPSPNLDLPHNFCVCAGMCVCVSVWGWGWVWVWVCVHACEGNRLMLFTCLVSRLRDRFNPLYCELFPPASISKSAEPILLPLLLSSVGQHKVSSTVPKKDPVYLLCLLPPSAPLWVTGLGLTTLEVETRKQAPGTSLGVSEPIVRGTRPHVFASSHYCLWPFW